MVDAITLSDESIRPRIAWDSVLEEATITSASTNEDDGAVEQVADWRPWTFWRPTGAAPHSIEADLGGMNTVNAWAIAGHDAAGLVSMYSWNGTAWVLHSEVISPGDGSVLYLVGSAVTTTKLKFTFTTITFLSILWAGEDVILPEGVGPGWTDPNLALRADVNPEVSRDGVWLGASVDQWTTKLDIQLRNVEMAWAKDYWQPFIRRCSTQPFFLHWNTSDWPNSACLCTSAQFGSAAFAARGLVDLSVSFTADPGLDRRLTPNDETPALLLEIPDGPLLLE